MPRLLTAFSAPALAMFLLAATAISAAPQSKTYALRSARTQAGVDLVQAVLEVGGDLKMVEEGKVNRVKMNVVAKFVYDEKSLRVPSRVGGPMRSVRHY